MEKIIIVVSGGMVDEVYFKTDYVEAIVIDLDLVGEQQQVTSEAYVRTLRQLPDEYQRIIDDDEYAILPFDGAERQAQSFADTYTLVIDTLDVADLVHSTGYKVQDIQSLLVKEKDGEIIELWFSENSVVMDTTWFMQLNFK